MGFGNLMKTWRKLNRMGRWANEYMTEDVRPTISSHSFTVAQTAQMLGVIEEQSGKTVDWKNLYEKAINHDVKEALTGDILSHVKNYFPEMKELILQIENGLSEKEIFSKLPKEYVERYRTIFNNDKDETLEGQILEAADKIDCLVECLIEIQRNNPEKIFIETYKSYVEKLVLMELESTKYFLYNILLDEMLGNDKEMIKMTLKLINNKIK